MTPSAFGHIISKASASSNALRRLDRVPELGGVCDLPVDICRLFHMYLCIHYICQLAEQYMARDGLSRAREL